MIALAILPAALLLVFGVSGTRRGAALLQRPACPSWCQSPAIGADHAHYVTVGAVPLDPEMPAGDDLDLWPSVQVELLQPPGEQPCVSITGYMGADIDATNFDLDQAAELHRALGAALALARMEATA